MSNNKMSITERVRLIFAYIICLFSLIFFYNIILGFEDFANLIVNNK